MTIADVAKSAKSTFNDTVYAFNGVLIARFGVDDVAAARRVVVAATIAALILLWVFHSVLRQRSSASSSEPSRKKAIVMLGCADAGKTCLWQALKYGEQRFATVTSLSVGEDGDVRVQGTNARGKQVERARCRVVHTPGHGKLRREAMMELARASAVVFVVDSSTFATDKRDVARYLFNILSSEDVQRRRVPILVACNKNDKLTAHPPEFIRKRLEKEIESIRETSASELPEIAVTKAQKRSNEIRAKKNKKLRALGQRPGETFTFDAFTKATKIPVSVGKTSATKIDVAAVRDFIIQRA